MLIERRQYPNHDGGELDNIKLPLLKHPKFLLTLYAAGLIWIGFNKALVNKLMITTRIQEEAAADSRNSMLPTQTKATEKE